MGGYKIGVPQGSVLGLLLYNTFINDIFWFANHVKICSYVDDSTVLVCHSDLRMDIQQLEDDCSVIVLWFSDLNNEKCYFVVFGDKTLK